MEFGYGIPEQFDKERLTGGTLRIASQDFRVTELTVEWNGGKFPVPATEFGSVPNPQLETLKVLRGKFSDNIENNAPYLVVEFRFGQPTLGECPRAQFLFYSGRYQRLMITTRTSETTWETSDKLPDKGATPKGTTTLLLPDPTSLVSPTQKPAQKDTK